MILYLSKQWPPNGKGKYYNKNNNFFNVYWESLLKYFDAEVTVCEFTVIGFKLVQGRFEFDFWQPLSQEITFEDNFNKR